MNDIKTDTCHNNNNVRKWSCFVSVSLGVPYMVQAEVTYTNLAFLILNIILQCIKD